MPFFAVCTNNTKIITDPKKIYGYYKRSFTVQNPVGNITVEGDVWLKHDDLCKLQFKYQGTGPFQYCVISKNSKNTSELQSAVGDASECDVFAWKKWDLKNFEFHRFFMKTSDAYSLFIYVRNEVSLASRVVGIHYYKRKFRIKSIIQNSIRNPIIITFFPNSDTTFTTISHHRSSHFHTYFNIPHHFWSCILYAKQKSIPRRNG